MVETTIHNELELQKFAFEFAKKLKGKEIIGLVGDLGAGKTTFTKYLGAALGVTRSIKSPTFIIAQIFETQHKLIKKLVHFDAYRLKSYGELVATGFLDYAGLANTVVVVEWANLIPEIKNFPKYTELNFKIINEHTRFVAQI